MKTVKLILLVVVALSCVSSGAWAGATVQWLTGSDVTTYVPEDTTLGEYHFVELAIPAGVTEGNLLAVFLECYLDVDVRAAQVVVGESTVEYKEPAPVLQVYPLTEAWSGTVEGESLDEDAGERITVRAGEDRRVRIDITRMVKGFLRNPSGNHGFVIGSLTNDRSGLFGMSDDFGGGNKVKVTYYR